MKQQVIRLTQAVAAEEQAREDKRAARKAKKAARKLQKQQGMSGSGGSGAAAAAPAPVAPASFAFDLKAPAGPSKPLGALTFSTPIPTTGAAAAPKKQGKGRGGDGGGEDDDDEELSPNEKALQLLIRGWDDTVNANFKKWNDSAGAVQQAIEILGNLCLTDDDEKAAASGDVTPLPQYLTKELLSSNVLNKLLTKIQTSRLGPINQQTRTEESKLFTAAMNMLSPEQFAEMHSALTTVRIHSINCLGNMVLALPANGTSHTAPSTERRAFC